jgi:hypothetical protein
MVRSSSPACLTNKHTILYGKNSCYVMEQGIGKELCSYGDGATHLQRNFVAMEINQQPILQRSFVPMEIQQKPICKRSTVTIVGDTAAVPELAEEDGALVVDGLDNGLPSLRLLLGPDSGRVGEALVSDGNTCGFRDDQTSRCCTL